MPGAGLAFLRAVAPVTEFEKTLDGDEKTGARIVRHALEVVTRTIGENSGMDPGVVVERMKNGTGTYGVDASNGRWGDLLEMGIIDPVKVLRLALESTRCRRPACCCSPRPPWWKRPSPPAVPRPNRS